MNGSTNSTFDFYQMEGLLMKTKFTDSLIMFVILAISRDNMLVMVDIRLCHPW